MEHAVQMVRDDFPIQLLNDLDDSPEMVIEEVADGWEGYRDVQPGFAFFGEEG